MRIPFGLVILCLACYLSPPAYAGGLSAPPAPNESLIEGVVLEHAVLSSTLVGVKPEMKLYAITVMLERSTALKGVDMLKDKVGTNVRLYGKEEIPQDIYGEKVKAKAAMRGDRMFWVYDIEAVK